MGEHAPWSAGKAVGLLTEDPALYEEVSAFLMARDMHVLSLGLGERIPREVCVVVTSPDESPAVDFPIKVTARRGRMEETWVLLQAAVGADLAERDVTVGVDPGPRPGLAVVLDGERCVASGTLNRPEEVATVGRRIRETFPRWGKLKFRVGNGDHVHQSRIVNALLPLGVTVEVVDERGTTPHGMRNNDEVSAIVIALTQGKRVCARMEHCITEREIRNVQRLSRESSGGRYTIPHDLARQVLEGRATLPEAIRLAKDHKDRRGARG